uniref:Uncharacterized protein n=1 Tax=Physcomitrium patens TaxID=3218 RepID=A0A2K1IJS2_PHYPA|nr:hypothetical protein PHYPA_028223 [Physcomitrium patens]
MKWAYENGSSLCKAAAAPSRKSGQGLHHQRTHPNRVNGSGGNCHVLASLCFLLRHPPRMRPRCA